MEFDDILVPVDFSEPSVRALRLAVGLARHTHAHVHLLHIGVVPHFYATELGVASPTGAMFDQMTDAINEEQKQRLDALAEAELPEEHRGLVHIREGFPPEEILAEIAEQHPDLLVMGTHGRTGIKRALLGSVTDRVVRECPIPCMVTH